VSIVLPPLRERREDILPLAKSFAERVYSLSPVVRFSSDALVLLENYWWPGNIRELENAVVRATAMCDGTIRAHDLPERVRNYRDAESDHGLPANVVPAIEEDWTSLATVEGRYVARVLAKTPGNKQAAARLLEVDRKTLDRMIKRHNISLDHAADRTPENKNQ
jgi:DNA-binding NtrC family response regulator